jgi:type II secretory pathway pseudopilin PulG
MSASQQGFTTLELLVAMALAVIIVGAALTVASSDAFPVQSEVSDMQQRLRVAADSLFRDLSVATAIRPYRAGGPSADPPGAFRVDTITALTPTTVTTYWLKSDDRVGVFQLMSTTGGGLDVPVVDNVVGLRFDYMGDPQPPMMVAPLDEPVGPWTTYGPRPAEVSVPPFPPRENCVFVDNGSNQPDPRLPVLAGEGIHLVPLDDALLSDGPWCPTDGAADRWDADLLRLRVITVTVRVQAASSTLRGPAGALFTLAGTARVGQRWVPDLEVRFRVAPRNISVGG